MTASHNPNPPIQIVASGPDQIAAWQQALKDNGVSGVQVVAQASPTAGPVVHVQVPERLGKIIDQIAQIQRRQKIKQTDWSVFNIGGMRFEDGFLNRAGAAVNLTDKERDILAHLCHAPGHEIPRKALLDAVWGYADTTETHTLETHIYRLRQKIEADPSNPTLLVTTDLGYALKNVEIIEA